jgi:hypothetical protein
MRGLVCAHVSFCVGGSCGAAAGACACHEDHGAHHSAEDDDGEGAMPIARFFREREAPAPAPAPKPRGGKGGKSRKTKLK